MNDEQAVAVGLKALRLHIGRLEAEGSQPVNLGAAIELCDQFAISGMSAEDFQLHAVAQLLAKMAHWPQSRLGDLPRADLECAADHIIERGLGALLDFA